MKIEFISGGVTAPKGFAASGVHCGIRKNKDKKDLALIYSDTLCACAAVYTQNLVKGAPITVTKEHIADGYAQAVICNSGNANTCNADGVQKAEMMCALAADALHISPKNVVVASTGVIGQALPMEPIAQHMGELASALRQDGSLDAAHAIMTTDTRVKEFAITFDLSGKPCVIGGIAKGSGMIHPNMATMLCFLTTDAAITPPLLDKALHEAIADSFHMVSVDGDTSTNDMVSILASGQAQNPLVSQESGDYHTFASALKALCVAISREIARDGEGATKLLECRVTNAPSLETARAVAKEVICSNLVKTAMFGSDANWGRVLCAIGYSGKEVDVHKVDVAFSSPAGCVAVCKNGAGIDFSEESAKTILTNKEVVIQVCLNDGDCSATAYGCDLTYEYVKINGDYRT